jgi:ATP-binding cassette subfamily C protein CydD
VDKRLWGEIKLARGVFWLTVIMQLASTFFLMLQAWAFSQIINGVFLIGLPVHDLTHWIILAVFGVLGRSVTGGIATITAANMATHIKADLRQRTMTYLMQLGPAFIQNERSGEIVTTLTEGVEKLDTYFRAYLPAILSAVFIPLCIIMVVLPLDLLTFIIFLLTAPLIPLFMALIGMSAGRLASQQHSRMSYLGAHFLDVMQGLTTLRLMNRSRHQSKTIRQITDDFRHATMKVLRIAFLSSFALELLATLSVAIVAVEIGVRLLHGGIPFEQALFLLVIAPEYYMPLRTLGARFHSGTEGKAVAERIYALLDTPLPHYVDSDQQADVPQWEKIQFDTVHFAYTPERPALMGISLTIQRGQQIAIVGESGSGKTTLAMLILRFLSAQTGTITVNDVPLNQIDKNAWRKQIAWVSQKPYLFNMSIADNIRMGRQTATEADIISAAKNADAHDFIMRLPDGYATPCGERGVQISGGQAQRIAIARAFLKDAPLIVFDEPTANLDAESQARVIDVLARLAQGRTVLSIAHRLDTVIEADMIYLMQAGQIIEQGTHQTLMAQNGLYAHMRRNYA